MLAEEIRKDRKKVTKNDAALRLASTLHKVSALRACSMSLMPAAAAGLLWFIKRLRLQYLSNGGRA